MNLFQIIKQWLLYISPNDYYAFFWSHSEFLCKYILFLGNLLFLFPSD